MRIMGTLGEKKSGRVGYFTNLQYLCNRFPHNRWQDAVFPVMLCRDDKQFNDSIKWQI